MRESRGSERIGGGPLPHLELVRGGGPRRDLGDFFRGDVPLREVMAIGPRGVSFLPGGCGQGDLADLGASRREQLCDALLEITRGFDRILIDLATGIGSTSMGLAARADQVLLLTTPEPTAITDAYAVTKILSRRGSPPPRIVVNRVKTPAEAADTFTRLARTASQHLGMTLPDWGFIPEDRAVAEAVAARIPFVLRAPSSPSSRRVTDIARRLVAGKGPGSGDRRPVRFPTFPMSPLAA
jgi:flagellar biosynthesis protein FlhG